MAVVDRAESEVVVEFGVPGASFPPRDQSKHTPQLVLGWNVAGPDYLQLACLDWKVGRACQSRSE
jgi:hypothetical protein